MLPFTDALLPVNRENNHSFNKRNIKKKNCPPEFLLALKNQFNLQKKQTQQKIHTRT